MRPRRRPDWSFVAWKGDQGWRYDFPISLYPSEVSMNPLSADRSQMSAVFM